MSLSILYVGPLNEGGVCRQRLLAFRRLGHQLHPLDTRLPGPRGRMSRLLDRAAWIAGFPRDPGGLNLRLVEAARGLAGQLDLVWIDKGLRVRPDTLLDIRASSSALVVNFNPDNPFVLRTWGWGWHKKCIPLYDAIFVPRESSVDDYKRAGARAVKRFFWGFSKDAHRPIPVSHQDRVRLGAPVGFIGTYEDERADAIRFLGAHGISVRVWGPDWIKKLKPVGKENPLCIEPQGLWGEDFLKGIRSFDINLGFLNKRNHDTLNTRCMAVTASEKFLLAERTEDLQGLFEEGKEAEFFADRQELLDKVQYYLHRPKEREQIAVAARRRCLSSDYSMERMLQGLLAWVTGSDDRQNVSKDHTHQE